DGNVKMTGGGGAGYNLIVYVSGNISFSGTWDKNFDPENLIVYGLPSCKTVTIATGSRLDCVLYAPEAAVSMVGNANFYGASVSDSMRMNGTTGFHYDESLAKLPVYRGYLITSWQEM